jgi:hypothetical protein
VVGIRILRDQSVFITASLVVYGLLWIVARLQTVRTGTTEKLTDGVGTKQSLVVRGYWFVHVKMFGSLFTMDSKRMRRLSEYLVTECQLLDFFWSCPRYERPRRRLSLRLLRLMSSLLVTASISIFFGTLEFDTAFCSTYAHGNLSSPSSSFIRSAVQVSPTVSHVQLRGHTPLCGLYQWPRQDLARATLRRSSDPAPFQGSGHGHSRGPVRESLCRD